MKMGRQLETVREMLQERGLLSQAMLVQNCGMEQERVCLDLQEASCDASYFSMIVVKGDGK